MGERAQEGAPIGAVVTSAPAGENLLQSSDTSLLLPCT
jgi:hypothetical protein